MQSDTVIGIVGAVVLVAVMVGVFAYEYNNVEEPTGDDRTEQEQRMDRFNSTYPALDPFGNIDDDDLLNWEDDDIDGDDVDEDWGNNDTVIAVVWDLSHNAPQYTNPLENGPLSGGEGFVVGQGYVGISGAVSHGGGIQDTARVQAVGGDAGGCQTDDSHECQWNVGTVASVGPHTLQLRQTAVNNNALATTVTVTVLYPPPVMTDA